MSAANRTDRTEGDQVMRMQPFGHIYIQPNNPAQHSWWADYPHREGFTARAKQEEPRMRCSKAYSWLGLPPVIGQMEPNKAQRH